MAYRGDWKAYSTISPNALTDILPQRDKQRRSIRTWIYVGYDRTELFLSPYSEQENQGRMCRHLHVPLLIFIETCSIPTLSNQKERIVMKRVEQLRQEAITQANRYAASETVQKAIGTTTLHKIIVVYQGMKMVGAKKFKVRIYFHVLY